MCDGASDGPRVAFAGDLQHTAPSTAASEQGRAIVNLSLSGQLTHLQWVTHAHQSLLGRRVHARDRAHARAPARAP